MGAAKHRQLSRALVLEKNPWCIYCGAPATTTDHCPPRSFFWGRVWPETYEFSCCELCNEQGRRDEAVVAVVVRIRLHKKMPAEEEWRKLSDGLKNNQPEIYAEWQTLSRNALRRQLRQSFGSAGDEMRADGWGAITIGPLTQAAINRFARKLAAALFFQHAGSRFDGYVFSRKMGVTHEWFGVDALERILKYAPNQATIARGKQSLSDQFNYRFNCAPDPGILHAVVEFSPQFLLQIMALSPEALVQLNVMRVEQGQDIIPAEHHAS